jgi:hypothetical protein
MAATATAAAPQSASGSPAGGAQSIPVAQFRAGTFRTLSSDGYSVSQALGTTAAQLTPYTPSPNAYIRGIWIQAVATGSNVAGATVATTGDGPFNVYQSITFQDANEKPILGPFDGYTLMCVNKFGGYARNADPRASAIYSNTQSSASTAGSFTFVLYVPLELVSRDTLGALQNKSSSSSFQLLLTVNTTANVFTTAPAASCTLVTTCFEDGWVQPKPTDATGTPLAQSPPQLGTTQYWTRGSYNALNGSQQVQLNQGLGYPIRNFMALNYDTSNTTRATGDTDFPTNTQFLYKGTSMWNTSKTIWKDQMSHLFGLTSTTADAANGLENGVYVLPFDDDFTQGPGAELRNGYLPTQQGDQFQVIATWNGSSTLYWVANYVAPAAGPSNIASIRGGR